MCDAFTTTQEEVLGMKDGIKHCSFVNYNLAFYTNFFFLHKNQLWASMVAQLVKETPVRILG